MRILAIATSTLVLTCGCGEPIDNRAGTSAQDSQTQHSALAPGAFRITDVMNDPDGSVRYVASADSAGHTCQFEIWIGAFEPVGGGPFSFTTASLSRSVGSDCSEFLNALASTLGFEGKVPTADAVNKLDASMAILGQNQSRASANAEVAGGFTSNPLGPWLVTKLFLADGEGEVFLNLNPDGGTGEFSLKDEEYATVVVTELAKVLLPGRSGT